MTEPVQALALVEVLTVEQRTESSRSRSQTEFMRKGEERQRWVRVITV